MLAAADDNVPSVAPVAELVIELVAEHVAGLVAEPVAELEVVRASELVVGHTAGPVVVLAAGPVAALESVPAVERIPVPDTAVAIGLRVRLAPAVADERRSLAVPCCYELDPVSTPAPVRELPWHQSIQERTCRRCS